MKLFALDSPFMEGMRKLADVIIINVLFCFCSIPLFTMGASFAALTESVQILADDRDNGLIFLDFFKAFAKHFKKGTLLELILGLCVGFLVVYRRVIGMMDGMMSRSYQITWIALVIILIFIVQFLFPTLVYKGKGIRETIKEAVLLSVVRFPFTLLSIAVLLAALGLSYMIYLQSGYGVVFVWMMAGIAILSYFNEIIYGWAIKKERQDGYLPD